MGASSNNQFYNAYESLKSLLLKFEKNKKIEIEAFLISTKSIPNFIKIIEDSKVLKNLNNYIKKNEINDNNIKNSEIQLKHNLCKYNIENINIYYDYNSCINLINDKEKNEFIIVDNLFLQSMNIKQDINQYKKVVIKIDKDNSNMNIKFKEGNIDFREKMFGFFEFCLNNYKKLILKEEIDNNINKINFFQNEDNNKDEDDNYNFNIFVSKSHTHLGNGCILKSSNKIELID